MNGSRRVVATAATALAAARAHRPYRPFHAAKLDVEKTAGAGLRA